jgi:hypothetical protein
MDRSRREDPKLREVKAVLQRLQKISTEPAPLELPAPAEKPSVRSPRGTIVAACAVAVVLVIGGAYALIDFNRSTLSIDRRLQPPVSAQKVLSEGKPAAGLESPAVPRADAAVAAPASAAALETALGQLMTGRVQAARKQLLSLAPENAADVAWALARSYDPNFLGTIPSADAAPNVEEATRWYRAWYAAAVKQGLVADSVSLERIIGSMR